MYQTDMYEGMLAETVTMCGDDNTLINAYLARPLGAGPFPAVILLHHMPGWDEWYREATRRFAHHGYVALSPNLYFRVGHGTPEDVAVKVRADGGIPDDQVVGDVAGAMSFLWSLPYVDGRVHREARSLVRAGGGRAASSVSAKTDFLVAGEGGGSKRAEAERLGVRIISERDFLEMVGRTRTGEA